MVDQRFFANQGPFTLAQIAEWTKAEIAADIAAKTVSDVAPLDKASHTDISFFDNTKYIEHFERSRAGACFVRPKYAPRAPEGMITLVCDDPYRAYALVAQHFYPDAITQHGISAHAHIDPSATLGKDVHVASGAVIGAHAVIGERTSIGSNTVIGAGVVIGDDTRIGANNTLSHCLIGSRVIIHRGVHIGQDGFGFALGREGHVKVPQLGRVIIEDDVEIGSGTCIDRGTGPDTTIGAGTKIDNLVQIGHNVQVGRHAVIVAQAGIAGSSRIGDGVVIGGQVGIAGHLKVGSGARIAAQSGVAVDLEAGQSYGGSPAVPIKDWHRQVIALNRMIKKDK